MSQTKAQLLDGSVVSVAFSAGSVGAPSLYFTGDTNTGIYSPGADTLAFVEGGVEVMRIDSSGRVGIGTTSPSTALQVVGTARFGNGTAGTVSLTSDSNLSYYDSLNNAATAFQPGVFRGTELQFHTNTSGTTPVERVRIDSSGRVGIGTTTAVSTLNIRNDSIGSGGLAQSAIALTYSSTNYGQHFIDANGVYNIYANNNGIAGGNLQLRADTNLIFNTASNERFRCDSAGRLLVGTSSVTGIPATLNIIGGNNTVLHSQGANADSPFLFLSHARGTGSQTVNAQDGVGAVAFVGYDGTNALTAARIEALVDGTPGANDMPGRLVLSTTADGASSPTERMRISSDGTVALRNNLSFAPSGTKAFEIAYNSAAFYITNADFSKYAVLDGQNFTGWTFASDVRLKENIQDLEYGIAQLKALKPRRFNFIGQDSSTVGFIAQEVQGVIPEAVTGKEIPYEGTDTPQEKASKTLGITKDALIPLITKALQEAIAKIETLEADVAQLKGA